MGSLNSSENALQDAQLCEGIVVTVHRHLSFRQKRLEVVARRERQTDGQSAADDERGASAVLIDSDLHAEQVREDAEVAEAARRAGLSRRRWKA